MIYILYIITVAAVVWFSILASRYIDMIDRSTRLSGAFLGGVLLSAITSLPELFTSISATILIDNPSLCIGNILGSNLCVLLPGTLIGCVLSIVSWNYVSQAIYAAAEAEAQITFEVETPLVLMIAAIQFVCMLTASLILALLMAKDRKMHERKN